MCVSNFKWVKDIFKDIFKDVSIWWSFIKSNNKESYKQYFFEFDVQYSEKFHDPLNDLVSLHDRMKIVSIKTLVANLHDKTESYCRNSNGYRNTN